MDTLAGIAIKYGVEVVIGRLPSHGSAALVGNFSLGGCGESFYLGMPLPAKWKRNMVDVMLLAKTSSFLLSQHKECPFYLYHWAASQT